MPFGSRRPHRTRGQAAEESAIEVSADELPSQVVEDAGQGDEMEYEEQGGEDEEDEEEIEGKSCSDPDRISSLEPQDE